MKSVGNKSIRLGQAFNVMFIVFWILFSIIFLNGDFNLNIFYVAIIGVIIWSSITYLYFKVYEIYVEGNKIIIRNLFLRREFEKNDFIGIESTSLTPMIYKINFSGGIYFLFAVKNIVFIEFFRNGTNLIAELEESIRS